MHVRKRTGDLEEVSFDKVLNRIRKLSSDLKVNAFEIAQKVCSRIYDGVKTTELDELAAQMCSSMMLEHPDYGTLASRIIVSNHHKNTSPSFSETIQILWDNSDVHGAQNPLVSKELYDTVQKNKEKLNVYLDYTRDYDFDYFGFKTLEKAYLMRVNGRVVERPQHMFMRVALGIHGNDLKDALETYDMMSRKYFVHATPTLFNAGTPRPQCSSCFLLASEDSIEGIYNTLKECAMISKYAGGIGLHIHDIRARNSIIRGTNGTSTGIVPMLRVFNNTARYVNQCFTPDVTVYSKNGVVRMDQVVVGDELVTIDGTFKKVNSISVKQCEDTILEIRTKYSIEPIKVTKEHEMYVIPKQRKGLNFNVIKNRLANGIVEAKFIRAGDVTSDDLVGYSIPQAVMDIPEDRDFCRFYAIMIGDGHMYQRTKCNSVECGIALNNTSKVESLEFCKQYLRDRKIDYWVSNDDVKSTVSIRWTCNHEKVPIKYTDLYNVHGEKHIHPRFLNLPKDKMLGLIQGLIETNGSNLKEMYFHNTSFGVVMSLRYILLRLGVLTSGYIKDAVGATHTFTRSNGSLATITNRSHAMCYVFQNIRILHQLQSLIHTIK